MCQCSSVVWDSRDSKGESPVVSVLSRQSGESKSSGPTLPDARVWSAKREGVRDHTLPQGREWLGLKSVSTHSALPHQKTQQTGHDSCAHTHQRTHTQCLTHSGVVFTSTRGERRTTPHETTTTVFAAAASQKVVVHASSQRALLPQVPFRAPVLDVFFPDQDTVEFGDLARRRGSGLRRYASFGLRWYGRIYLMVSFHFPFFFLSISVSVA